MEKKGTVTELSSLYPAEEAQKASMRVQDAIAERQQQLNQVKSFIDDNISLINLVNKLPDETHHNIMVPFGKASFFPGRLIHTNEFMVLLGEGYYAERTSKQTVEILKRRGKSLETQTESLKAIMQDLKAEALFFDTTANEAAEGLVEIREDYVEEGSSATSPMAGYSKSDNNLPLEVNDGRATAEDEEYARIFSRMDDLEKEEEEAEKADESDDDEQLQGDDSTDQETEEDAEKADESNDDDDEKLQRQISIDQEGDVQIQRQIHNDQEVRSTLVETSETLPVSKGEASNGNYPMLNNRVMDKASELPEEENKIQPSFPASTTAFTGSIVERADNIGANLPSQQIGTRGSKPISRFKMQRK
ncbi:hypothetical protein ACS0TY_030117 [Phlomoides rotata]